VVLPNSYRLPSEILNVVNAEIRHIDKRQEKDLHPPARRGGSVEAIQSPSMLELVRNVRYTVDDDEGSVMCLFRARYQMFDFIDEFIDHGIPFTMLTDGRMWTDRVQDYVSAIIEKSDAAIPSRTDWKPGGSRTCCRTRRRSAPTSATSSTTSSTTARRRPTPTTSRSSR